MEQKNRTILVIAIAITVFAAVFVSFGLPSLTGRVPEVVLPDVSQEIAGENQDYLPVEVTPETVQAVIATLSRPESYQRELNVTLFWSGGSSSAQVRIWADGGYVKTDITTGGAVQHRLVGDGKLYLWYGGDRTWKELTAGETTGDLAQRIPTYEDVLALDPEQITDAGYERRENKDCIYVEVKNPDLDTLDRYWIETATGLLWGAETLEGDQKVYEMTETSCTIPLGEEIAFSLPDGTVLHTSSAVSVQEENGGQR